jgi:hypothetical protein
MESKEQVYYHQLHHVTHCHWSDVRLLPDDLPLGTKPNETVAHKQYTLWDF